MNKYANESDRIKPVLASWDSSEMSETPRYKLDNPKYDEIVKTMSKIIGEFKHQDPANHAIKRTK